MQYLESGHSTLQNPADVPDEFDDPNHHQALAFEHYTEAYGFFLEGADTFEEQDQILEARYGKVCLNLTIRPIILLRPPAHIAKKNESVMVDLEQQKELLHQIRTEYEKAKSAGVRVLRSHHSCRS